MVARESADHADVLMDGILILHWKDWNFNKLHEAAFVCWPLWKGGTICDLYELG